MLKHFTHTNALLYGKTPLVIYYAKCLISSKTTKYNYVCDTSNLKLVGIQKKKYTNTI